MRERYGDLEDAPQGLRRQGHEWKAQMRDGGCGSRGFGGGEREEGTPDDGVDAADAWQVEDGQKG